MAKRRRLSDPRDVGEVLADGHSGGDHRLMSFLQQVSVRTRVYAGAAEFVDELHRRWSARASHRPRPAGQCGRRRAPVWRLSCSPTSSARRNWPRAWATTHGASCWRASSALCARNSRPTGAMRSTPPATASSPPSMARPAPCRVRWRSRARRGRSDLRIRAGVHTGEIEAGGDKVGRHRGAHRRARDGPGGRRRGTGLGHRQGPHGRRRPELRAAWRARAQGRARRVGPAPRHFRLTVAGMAGRRTTARSPRTLRPPLTRCAGPSSRRGAAAARACASRHRCRPCNVEFCSSTIAPRQVHIVVKRVVILCARPQRFIGRSRHLDEDQLAFGAAPLRRWNSCSAWSR